MSEIKIEPIYQYYVAYIAARAREIPSYYHEIVSTSFKWDSPSSIIAICEHIKSKHSFLTVVILNWKRFTEIEYLDGEVYGRA